MTDVAAVIALGAFGGFATLALARTGVLAVVGATAAGVAFQLAYLV